MRLTWAQLPPHVRAWVGDVLDGPVVGAVSQPGGFSPGSADRVVTDGDRRAFVKAVSPDQNPRTPDLHRREVEVLRTLAGLPEAPRLVAASDDGHWVVLVVEDVEGRHPSLPWTDEEVAATLHTLTCLATRPAPPTWPALEEELVGEMTAWSRVRESPDAPVDLDPWTVAHLSELDALARATLPRLAGDRIVHTDLRADNLLVTPDGRVRVVDWPWASRGAAWFDAATLLLNVRWSGPLDVRPHLGALRDLGATDEDVLGVLAGLAGYLVEAAAQPPAPGLPTLRAFQREQGRAALALLQELWPAG
ncbi:aminoglycoside phosphotransferase family protein [Ornithinimicrobium pekingense]|uniref:aminoglycoside phosphotransferase family protein n=1 Tax=Ornithinimicrobium pekingense TaxID=384677 RepID=UPI00192A72B0|nr:aminoglycoside phosphotransferase family protein [Ornithinimicrobium pekingense]